VTPNKALQPTPQAARLSFDVKRTKMSWEISFGILVVVVWLFFTWKGTRSRNGDYFDDLEARYRTTTIPSGGPGSWLFIRCPECSWWSGYTYREIRALPNGVHLQFHRWGSLLSHPMLIPWSEIGVIQNPLPGSMRLLILEVGGKESVRFGFYGKAKRTLSHGLEVYSLNKQPKPTPYRRGLP